MKLAKVILGKNGVVDKVKGLAKEAITDVNKRNMFLAQLAMIVAQNKVAKYVRAGLASVTVVSVFFFSDNLSIDPQTQTKLLFFIFGFYFLDYMRDMIK